MLINLNNFFPNRLIQNQNENTYINFIRNSPGLLGYNGICADWKEEEKMTKPEHGLSKPEALALLLQGRRICHRFYAPDEWLELNLMGLIQTNDGCLCGDEYGHFWTVDQEWKDGWGIHPTSQTPNKSRLTFTVVR